MFIPFINDAVAAGNAAAPAGQQASSANMIIMLLVFLAIFYFLLIRPQSKRNKAQQQLINGLQKGDEVVTIGGMLGRILNIEENIITLELSENLQIKIQKSAVASVLPKGTLKG